MKPAVRCISLSKNYQREHALRGVNLEVFQGEILAVIGPSGCGKTTLLRLIAGFEIPTRGEVILGDRLVASPTRFIPPERRGIGMVFQDHTLFPHLTVTDNIGFGLNGSGRGGKEQVVSSMLKLVGMDSMADRYPHELSGGEKQRVALARALAPQPILILFDEPFSNLDADRRIRMREEVRAILKSMDATAILVTHDQEEALFMGDRLAVLKNGSLEQTGNPEEIYHRPKTRFVAEFMGQTDFIPGEVVAEGILTELGLLGQPVELPVGSPVDVAFRPDDVAFEPDSQAPGLILSRHFKGSHHIYRLRLQSGQLIHAWQPHTATYPPGTRVAIEARPGHVLAVFPRPER